MGCLKLRYYQPEPTLKVVYGKTEPQQKGVQSWLSVDPLADERSWVSPYSYVQNSPVMRVDPSGALDTKYEDEEGNSILETNDGSDAVIEVSDDRLAQLKLNYEMVQLSIDVLLHLVPKHYRLIKEGK